VLGRTPQWHDLTVLENGLRSHGGRYEEMVPFILSAPLNADLRRAGARRRAELRYFRLYMQRNQTMNASSLIAGKAAVGGSFVVVRSPYNGAEAGRVAAASRQDVEAAVAAAHARFATRRTGMNGPKFLI
jgi:hypothetical protein